MIGEFDRYAIERIMRSYSNDLLSASHAGIGDVKNSIARAQSMLSDFEYLADIAAGIRVQVSEAQHRESMKR